MPWLLFALFAAAGFGLSSLIDKLFISKFLKNDWSYYCWWGIYSLAVSPVFLFFLDKPLSFNIFAVFAGIAGALGSRVYLAAISEDDISNVTPIFFTAPLFALIFSVIFLGETVQPLGYAGILVLVFGAVLMGVREPRKLRLTKGVKIAIVSAVINGVYAILYKKATGIGGVFEISFWEWLVFGLVAIPIGGSHLKGAFKEFGKLTFRQKALMLLTIPIIVAAFLALVSAYSLQAAPLVAAVGASQPLFVFFYAGIASTFIPKLFKEELKTRTVIFKLIGGILIVVGVYMVSI